MSSAGPTGEPTDGATGEPVERHLRGLARGGAIGLAGAACSAMCGFALVVVVARGFDPVTAGGFFAATALCLMVSGLCGLGTETGLARFLLRHARSGRPQDVAATIRVAALPAVVAALLGAAVLVLAAGPIARTLGLGASGPALIRVLALAVPSVVVAELCLATTRAFGDMRPTAAVDRVLRAGLQPLLALAAVAAGGGLAWLGATWAAAYVVAAGVALVLTRRFLRPRTVHGSAEAPGRVAREFWSFTWPRGLTRLAQTVIQKADIVLVAALLSPAHAAVYTVATRFVALGQFATQALQQAIQPRFTMMLLAGSDRSTLREFYRVATSWNIALTWPLYLVIGCAPAAYLSLFGGSYVSGEAQRVVVVMLFAMLLAVASGPVDTLLLMAGRSRASLANALTAMVVDLLLCLWLIPRLGLPGAALAWAAAVTTRCGLAFLQVHRQQGVTPFGPEVALAAGVALLLVGGPVLAFTLAGGEQLVSLVPVALAAALLYVAALRVLRRPLRLDSLAVAFRSRARIPEESSMRTAHPPLMRRALTRLRRRLPSPTVSLARWCALRWGMLTAGSRMQPSFIVVGAQRCGTTTLFRLLEQHPDLIRPTLSKGTGYFDDEFDRGERWYRAHFPLALTGLLRTGRPGRARTFEVSGYYMFHPQAAQRIAAALPGVQLVALVRDPAERAHSAHQHETLRGYDHLDFLTAVALEPERTVHETHLLEHDPHHRSFRHRHHAYLARGRYAEQLARLVEAVGPERVHVVDADEFFADPVPAFLALQEWLGLRPWVPPSVPQANAHERTPLPPAERAALLEYFAEDDAALTGFLGHVPSWRRPLDEPAESPTGVSR